jgi:hypothetical protein
MYYIYTEGRSPDTSYGNSRQGFTPSGFYFCANKKDRTSLILIVTINHNIIVFFG